MKAVATIVLACLMAGCGGGSSKDDDRADTIKPQSPSATKAAERPKAAAGRQLTVAQLTAALLTVQDLPTGYSLDTSGDDDSPDSSSGDAPCARQFDNLENLNKHKDVTSAERDFTKGGFGPFVTETLASYRSDDAARDTMKVVTGLFQKCQSFTATDPDDKKKSTYTIAPVSFPKIGDQTLAVTATIKSEDIEVTAVLAFARLGQHITYLAGAGLAGFDATELEQLMRKASSRLSAAR